MSLPPSLFRRFRGSLSGRTQLWVSSPKTTRLAYAQVDQAILDHLPTVQWQLEPLLIPPDVETAWLSLIPLILYGHDVPIALKDWISTIGAAWPEDWRSQLQQWSALLCQLLCSTYPLDVTSLIQTSGVPAIATWLEQTLTLHDVQRYLAPLTSPSFAIALYCFCSTPEDPCLTVHRAAGYSRPAAAIAQTLSGAHTGDVYLETSIPVFPEPTRPLHGTPESPDPAYESTPFLSAEYLWQLWSGVHTQSAEATVNESFGRALTLQPRPMRSLISLETR